MLTAQQLQDLAKHEEDLLVTDTGGVFISQRIIGQWNLLPLDGLGELAKKHALRLNSLANLYYFAVQVLKKDRFQKTTPLSRNLHYQMCAAVMKDGLKEVIEIPRDHFKSSVYSECFPIWRALPFTEQDETLMRALGVSDLYIEWMHIAHNQDVRHILISENQTNAVKLGTKIKNHYENNDVFRYVFSDILPTSGEIWTAASLHHKRTAKGKQHGEGTYDFIGVGGALQSRHYDDSIQDDLVGRDALNSETEMNKVIEYHQLLVGAMDANTGNAGRDNDEIVVGNRWSYKDLNSHIRDNEPYYNFITHSAIGGCCSLHPYGTPIFPESFTMEKLARWKQRIGSYLFSCQFLNFPINPEVCKFEQKDLRYFEYIKEYSAAANPDRGYRIAIKHQVREGVVEPLVFPRNLERFMIVDPNHAGNAGRCRHAITITGVNYNPRRIYLLDAWAESCSIEKFIATMFNMAVAFKINDIWLETIAAQKYLKFHLEYYIEVNKTLRPEIAHIQIKELKTPKTANAKQMRIEGLKPIFERGEFWVNKNGCAPFFEEYEAYGNKRGLIDTLDTLGYGTQVWKFPDLDDTEMERLVLGRQREFERALSAAQG